MLGTCAQCDESNVVMNVPRIRNILLYKNVLCLPLLTKSQIGAKYAIT